jgi:hypothetical protein
MNLFGFRRPGLTVVKAWCSPFGAHGPAGEVLALVDRLVAALPEAPLEGAIDDGEPQPLSALRRALARLQPAELESLQLFDPAGELALFVGADAGAAAPTPVFLFIVVLPPTVAASRDRVLGLLAAEGLHYGYARVLAPGVDPIAEAKLRRSLPAPSASHAGAAREGWLVPEADIRAGAVRGLFPANMLSAVALARLSGSGLKLQSSIPAFGGVLWRLDAAEQQEIVRRNPDYRAFLHFGDS